MKILTALILGGIFLISASFLISIDSIPKKFSEAPSEKEGQVVLDSISLPPFPEPEDNVPKSLSEPIVALPEMPKVNLKMALPIQPPTMPETPKAPSAYLPAPSQESTESQAVQVEPEIKPPALDEEAILKAIVKIECPASGGLGEYIGSGFSVSGNLIITAAHVVKDSGSDTCEVIFPRERRPIHYLKGAIADFKDIGKRHDEEGIDVAVLRLPPIDTYPEAKAIFESYPVIPYPICSIPRMFGDKLFHYGYPANYKDQNYLSRQEGEMVLNASIGGVKEQLSQDQTYTFKNPIFVFTYDFEKMYPYMVSRVPSFYGDSGGLAFNADKQCILGPHRGGTIGKTGGKNYSIFVNLGWEGATDLLP